jgi:hypothetical protein
MHNCEECDAACYCDMDDCHLPTPTNCRHRCPEDENVLDDDDGPWCSEAGPLDAVCDLDRDHGGAHRGWSSDGRIDWLPAPTAPQAGAQTDDGKEP